MNMSFEDYTDLLFTMTPDPEALEELPTVIECSNSTIESDEE